MLGFLARVFFAIPGRDPYRTGAGISARILAAALAISSQVHSQPKLADESNSTSQPMEIYFNFQMKRPTVSAEEFRAYYERVHAAGASAPATPDSKSTGMLRYGRSYVVSAVGQQPDFAAIMETAWVPGTTMVMGPTESFKDDPFMSGSKGCKVSEKLLIDGALNYEHVLVRKRAFLLKRSTRGTRDDFDDDVEKVAAQLAEKYRPSIHRLAVESAVSGLRGMPTREDPKPAEMERFFDAIIMVWPAGDAILPAHLDVPSSINVISVLELEAYYAKMPKT